MAPRNQAVPYDFRQAHSLSSDQMRELNEHCANLCRALQRYIPDTTGVPAHLSVVRIVPMTYDEYLDAMPEGPIVAACEFPGNTSPMLWQIDAVPLFAYTDAMLGGDGAAPPPVDRELTVLERALAQQVVEEFVGIWRESWQALDSAGPQVREVRQSTGSFVGGSLGEAVVAVELTFQAGDAQGAMRAAIPTATLRGILKQPGFTLSRGNADHLARVSASAEVRHCVVTVAALLARAQMSLQEFLSLKPGDVVQLDRGPNDALEVAVAGVPKFRAVSGLTNGHLAVRVAEVIDQDEAPAPTRSTAQVPHTHS